MNNNPNHGNSHTSKVLGLTGTTKDARIAVEAPAKIAPLPVDLPHRDIDLRHMAQWAMNYLIRTPRKELNYEPVFQCYPMRCPPVPAGRDVVVPCDTDARLNWEWYVNMSFSRTSPWGRVVSFLPDVGRLTVRTEMADTFFLRPPHWAPRESVRAFIGAREIPVVWSGAYIRFDGSKPGDELTITYPLVRFSHTPDGVWKGKMQPVVDLTFDWVGNTIVGSAPPPDGKPLFTGTPRILPPPPSLVDSSQKEGAIK